MARWARFNLVGALGAGVQLGVLAGLNRIWRGHYLMASAVALEASVLHNFVWHLQYTWRDRRGPGVWLRQCWRFHASNGLISLGGNLAVMKLLVGLGHAGVVAANAVAIGICSVVNFAVGHTWAFAAGQERKSPQREALRA